VLLHLLWLDSNGGQALTLSLLLQLLLLGCDSCLIVACSLLLLLGWCGDLVRTLLEWQGLWIG
jgi:hypothetical protein